MRTYLVSLGAGLLVGVVYSLIGMRSPAPPPPSSRPRSESPASPNFAPR